ncbi:MAG: helix-hairpin-helix domain-containing protein [Dorea sp.]
MKCEIKKKKRIGIVFICLCVFSLTACRFQSGFERSMPDEMTSEQGMDLEESTGTGQKSTESAEIYVHVCGCVKNPGLYRLFPGIRAGEAIEEAGGFTKKADTTAVNLAESLSDGCQLYVPAKAEKNPKQAEGGEAYPSSQSGDSEVGKVNLNTASSEELTTLSGIGSSRAEAILAYREEHGSFSSIEDIKNVSGIGDGIFEKIKDSITV